MERLALIGVSYRRGGAAALEAWHASLNQTSPRDWLNRGFREAILLSTCNRCDLIVSLPETMSVADAKQQIAPSQWPRCYAYKGEGAVEQLARIASSLDSLNPGEYQIMQQVREAFSAAEEEETLGRDTRFAFTAAFRIAKRVRREVDLAPLNTSLFSLARPELEARIPAQARIGIVGTGEIGQLAARVLNDRPDTTLVLINRTRAKADALARQLTASTEILDLESFLSQPPSLHALVCATPVPQLVDEALLDRLPDVRAIVDMGIPRNVDSQAAEQRDILVLDVDTLQEAGRLRRHKIERNLIRAEEILLDELDLTMEEWLERQLGPAIRSLRESYIDTISDDIPESQVQRLASRFAKLPIKGLRALARHHGIDAAKTFLDAIRNES